MKVNGLSTRVRPVVFGVLLAAGFASVAKAAPIGNLNIANCPGGGVTLTQTSIIWLPMGTGPETGCIDAGAGSDVASALGSVLPGASGDIKNLTIGAGVVDQFLTFLPPGPVLDFVLAGFSPPAIPDQGTDCAATVVGQSCVIQDGSPFFITNVGGGSSTN